MPYLDTAESWLTQSSLLLKARPTTTRITTKYRINPPLKPTKHAQRRKALTLTSDPSSTTTRTTGPSILVLKTYDPVSGVTLKYKTDKAADVGRLIASLGRLGRHMAALPEKVGMEDVSVAGVGIGAEVQEGGVRTPPVVAAAGGKAGGGAAAASSMGGKKGKKKGKK